MTRKDERNPKADEVVSGSDDEALDSAATRVVSDVDADSESEAATVLVDAPRNEIVTHPISTTSASADAEAATRVIDLEAPPSDAADEVETAESGTRVLEVSEDKTLPPPVSSNSSQAATPASNPRSPDTAARAQGLQPGMILFGEYEIINVLGVGGMGEVYRARHRRLDEFRAIKVMHAALAAKKGASEFFYREAKALLAVRHPAVVHCHDLLSDEEGRVYLIMEMIEGIPLSKKMNDGPLSPDDVAVLGARISHGLNAAHRKGVIHRDVSPDNIVLPNGRVHEAKLIDFGIAKILQEGDGTIIDGFKGKLSYASPEQLGFFGGKIDGRSDFYSLGLVLIAAALGRPMSMGTTVMEAVDARRGLGSLPDEIPMGLRSAIQPLLALDPVDRPKYVDRLFVVPGGTQSTTDPEGYDAPGSALPVSPRDSRKSGDRMKIGLVAGLVGAGAVLVGGGLYFALAGETLTSVTPGPIADRVSEVIATEDPTPIVEIETVVPIPPKPPEVQVEVVPPKPVIPKLSARDRIKIIGLLNNAKLALGENQLMSPANDNAYDRYRRILAIDSRNQKAKDGLTEIAGRYLSLVDTAIAKGDLSRASTYMDRARKADSSHPGIASAESRLGR